MAAPMKQDNSDPRPKRGRPRIPISEKKESKRRWENKRRKQMVYISKEMARWASLRKCLGLEDKDNPVVAKYLLDLYSNITKQSLDNTCPDQTCVGLSENSPQVSKDGMDHRRKRIEDIASKIKRKMLSERDSPVRDSNMAFPTTISSMSVSTHILFKELDSESVITVARQPEVKLTNDKCVLDMDTAMAAAQGEHGPWRQYCKGNRDTNQYMMTGLYKLWQVNKYLDAVLMVNRHRVALHKIMLIGACPLLSDEFGEEPVHEMNEYRLEIDNTFFRESTLVSLVRYLYTGTLVCNPLQLHALHRLAGLLKINTLWQICDKEMVVEKLPFENGIRERSNLTCSQNVARTFEDGDKIDPSKKNEDDCEVLMERPECENA